MTDGNRSEPTPATERHHGRPTPTFLQADPDLGDAVRAVARQRGSGVSKWLAEAAAAKLRTEALAQYLDDWEAEHGPLTAGELAKAAAELALPEPATGQPAT